MRLCTALVTTVCRTWWLSVSTRQLLAAVLLIVTWFNHAFASPTGAPCSALYSLKPADGPHGKSSPDPFPFELTTYLSADPNKSPVNRFANCQLYTVRISGPAFQGLLLQARQVGSDGKVVEAHRVGDFLEEANWVALGIRHQQCSTQFARDSVTHQHTGDKQNLELQWRPVGAEGPIQFMMTIMQTQRLFWEAVAPLTGRLQFDATGPKGDRCPQEDIKYFESISTSGGGITTTEIPSVLIDNNLLATTSLTHQVNASAIDGLNKQQHPESFLATTLKLSGNDLVCQVHINRSPYLCVRWADAYCDRLWYRRYCARTCCSSTS